MKYSCLVLDHEDTVVTRTATANYPCFVEYMRKQSPPTSYTTQEY